MDEAQLREEGWFGREVEAFSGIIGLLWISGTVEQPICGFLSNEGHANRHMGTVHGGVMMTFADIALGYGVASALATDRPNIATIQLQVHFVAAPKVGSFITCRPEVVRRATSMVFVRGLLMEGDRVVARLTYTGTHTGELFGFAPTGRRVSYIGVALFRVALGQIAEGWVLGDLHDLIRQLKGET